MINEEHTKKLVEEMLSGKQSTPTIPSQPVESVGECKCNLRVKYLGSEGRVTCPIHVSNHEERIMFVGASGEVESITYDGKVLYGTDTPSTPKVEEWWDTVTKFAIYNKFEGERFIEMPEEDLKKKIHSLLTKEKGSVIANIYKLRRNVLICDNRNIEEYCHACSNGLSQCDYALQDKEYNQALQDLKSLLTNE